MICAHTNNQSKYCNAGTARLPLSRYKDRLKGKNQASINAFLPFIAAIYSTVATIFLRTIGFPRPRMEDTSIGIYYYMHLAA